MIAFWLWYPIDSLKNLFSGSNCGNWLPIEKLTCPGWDQYSSHSLNLKYNIIYTSLSRPLSTLPSPSPWARVTQRFTHLLLAFESMTTTWRRDLLNMGILAGLQSWRLSGARCWYCFCKGCRRVCWFFGAGSLSQWFGAGSSKSQ